MTSKTKIKLMGALAIMGVLTTAGTAIRSGDRLSELYEMYIAEKNYSDRLSKDINKEYAVKAAKEVVPVLISAGLTIVDIIMLCEHSIKTETGLISALYFARALSDPNESDLEARFAPEDVECGPNELVFYDRLSDQIITTTPEKIRKAETNATRKLNQFYIARYSSVLADLGGSATVDSYYSGWEISNPRQLSKWNRIGDPYISLRQGRTINLYGKDIPLLEWNVQPSLLEKGYL
jgi:hypothetical protein